MSYELNGVLIEKFPTQQVSERFKKREFVVETTETASSGTQFTEVIKFQLSQDRCDLLDDYQVNDPMKVHFNLKGRKWEKDGKVSYFTNLEAWRLEKSGASNTDGGMPEFYPDAPPEEENYNDDLPF